MNGAQLLLVLFALAIIAANYLTEGRPVTTEPEPDPTPTCEVRGCTAPRMDDHWCGYHGPQW